MRKASPQCRTGGVSFQIEELEPRLLFSADAAALLGVAAAMATPAPAPAPAQAAAAEITPAPAPVVQTVSTTSASTAAPATDIRHELVFVDASVPEADQLVKDIQAGASDKRVIDVVVIQPGEDGLALITATLKDRHDLDAVHIISHGDDSGLTLGSSRLDSAALNAHLGDVSSWGQALTADADLLLYGCDLAENATGRALVDNLALLTGADVAASIDKTGSALMGGNWTLEYTDGTIETPLAVSAAMQASYQGLLQSTAQGTETLAHTATNGGTSETTTTNRQVAMDSSGNYVVVWNDGTSNLVFQRFNADGSMAGAKTTIATGTPTSPQVAMNASGAFVVVWSDASNNLNFQCYTAAGAAQGSTTQIAAYSTASGSGAFFTPPYTQTTITPSGATVAINSAGDFVVAYRYSTSVQSYLDPTHITFVGTTTTDPIMFKAYTSAGALQGTNGSGTISATTAGSNSPSIAMNAAGAFVVSWTDSTGNVYARAYTAARAAVAAAADVTGGGGGSQSSVGIDSSGNYVVAYQDAGVINYRMYNSSAVATTAVMQANLNPPGTTPTDTRTTPSVQMGTSGNFVIAWENASQDGSGNGVYYRQFYSNGSSGLSDQRVAASTSGDQQNPSVAFDGTHAVVVWSGNGAQSGQVDNQGVYFQRYTIAGDIAPGALTMTGTTLSYIENDTVNVDTGITLGADADDDYMDTVTVAITGNFVAGQDVLALTANSYGITGSYNATTGVLTLSGPATIANYQAALRANLTYTNSSDNPNTATRTFTVTVSDGSVGGAVSATRNMTVTAVNDAPLFTNTSTALAFTENGAAVVIDSGLTVTDPDSTNLTGATVQITGNFVSGADVLSYATVSGITGSWNATTGILTLTGTTTPANYQAALRTVKYQNTSDNPGPSKTITFSATDGTDTGTGTRAVAITEVNDAPVNTVPGAQNINEDTPLVFSSANGNALAMTDVDANNGILQAQVTVTNGTLTLSGTTGLTFTVGDGTADTTMTFKGTLAAINAALNGLTYTPTKDYNGSATLTFATSDLGNTGTGGAKTDSDTVAITIAAVNDPPAITNTASALAFTENGAAVVLDSGVTVVDVDSTTLTGATIKISSGYVNGEDVLSYATTAGITGSWNAATGTLTLTGTTTVANYQSAFRAVKYQNLSDNPGTSKTVTFSATDNAGATGSSTRNISVTAVNDAPVNTVPGAQNINEDTTLVFSSGNGNLISIADVDANAGLMQITVSVLHGTLSLSGTTGLSFTTGTGTANATMTFTGTVANVNAALAGLSYTPTANYNGSDTLTLVTSDQGNTGTGGAMTDTDTVAITLAAVNDAPVATITPTSYSATEQTNLALQGTGLSISDVDAGSSNVQAILSVMSGTLTVAAGSTGTAVSGSGTNSVTLTGTLTQINNLLAGNASGTITYIINSDTPPASDTLTLLANDLGNTGSGGAKTGSDTAVINITAVNDPPVITSNGGGAGASISVAENTTAVTTVIATDPDNPVLTYSIVAGGDGAKFTINASTGVLKFITAPDFENPTDADGNNIYNLTVRASDGSLSATQAIAVTVTDVPSTLIVDTIADTNDTGLGSSFNAEQLNASKGSDGKISLREAIIAANNTPGLDTITFNISGTAGSYGEYTITLASALPNLTDAVYINGASQPGTTSHPLIVLDGNGGAGSGLYLSNTADGSTIRGLVIRHFGTDGIYVQAGSDNNTIVGNYIGSFNADGSNAGTGYRNAYNGIESYGANLVVGGTTATDRNLVSGNVTQGIYLGTGADGTVIKGNYLGLNAAGNATFSTTNGAYGVMVETSATNVTVGGTAVGAGNVISGFTAQGVWVTTTGVVTVQGNYIGTDATGTMDLGNTAYGVYVDDAGSAVIGGTAAGAGNVISGNNGGGIYVASTGGATIQGNIIGLNAAGTAALGNTGVGIYLNTANASVIGGSTAAARNVISSNSTYGIQVVSSPTGGHIIKGNYIGVGSDGTTLLGNGSAGIYITGSNTVIGGKNSGDGNVIAGNGGAGIAVVGGTGNLFYRNSIFSNTGLGVDLNNDGVTLNDYNDGDGGANYLNNFPVITSVVTDGGSTTIQGSIDWYPQAQPIYIELYGSPTKDASGYGEGKTYLGAVQVTTDATTGDATFSITVAGVSVGDWITAIANVEGGYVGASEFAMAVQAVSPANAPRGKLIWNVNDRYYQNYADWGPSGWSGVGTTGLNLTDDISMIAAAESPTRNEIIFIGSADVSGKILAAIWNGTTWSSVLTLPLASPSAAASQYDSFAISYDNASGDAMLVWDNGNTGTTGLSYATWNGSSWSAIGTVNAPVSGEPEQMKLVSNPTTHEMLLAVSTTAATNNQYAIVWNGTNWGNAQTLGTNSNQQNFEINVAYEQVSGRAMVLYDASGSNSPGVQYRVWDGSTWSAESTVSAPAGVTATSDLYTTVVASDAKSNRIALAAQDAANEVWLAVWDGSSWGDALLATATGTNTVDHHAGMSVAFESQSGDLLAAYGKTTGPNVYYRTWTSGGGWSSELTGPSMGGTDVTQVLKLYSDPYTNTIMMGVQDDHSDLNLVAWDGNSWGTVTQMDANTGQTYREDFTYVWYRNAPVIQNLAGDTLAFTEGQASTVIDQGTAATVVLGSEGHGYAGGNLSVSFEAGSTNAEDVLGVRNQGVGAGQIGISGGNVTYAGTVIGTIAGGTGGVSLVITLNGNATDAAVGALINNVTYQNTNTAMPSTTNRTVRFVVTNSLGEASTNTDVTVTVAGVNDAPVNTVPAAQVTNEDTAIVFSSVNGNQIAITDVDVGSGSMQVTLSVLHGALTLSGISGLSFTTGDGTADGTMTFTGTVSAINAALEGLNYTPNFAYSGSDTLSILTSDQGNTGSGGTLTDSDTVAITVNVGHDAPVNTVPGAQTTNEDTAKVFSSANGNLISISDTATTDLKVTLSVLNGSLTLSGLTGLSFITGDGTADASMSFTGTIANINAALAGMSYTPAANYNGSDTLTIVTSDQGNTGSGTTLIDTDTVAITVNAVNDAPVNTVPPAQVTNEDTAIVFSPGNGNQVAISDVDAGSGSMQVTLSVLHGALTLSSVSGLSFTTGDGTADGTMTLTGTIANINAALAGLIYAPTANYNGSDTLTILTSDQGNTGSGGALTATNTVAITVNAVNDAPINTVPGAQTTNEDTAIVFSPGNGNQVAISDVDAGSGSMQVTLSVLHGALTLSGVSGLSFTTGDGTADASMVFTGTIANINAALAGLSYLPTANYNGSDTLTIVTSDRGNTGSGGTLTDTDTVAITVNAVNDAPVNTVPGAQTMNEDTAKVFSSANGNLISISDVDAGGGSMKVTLSVLHGALTLSGVSGLSFTTGDGTADASMVFTGTIADINAALAGLSYAPTSHYNGADTLTIVTSDQGNTGAGGAKITTDTVAITVNAVNNAPVNTVPGAQTINEDTALVFSSGHGNLISVADIDAGGGNMQVTLSVVHGALTLSGLSGLSFTTGDGSNDATMTFTGTLSAINTALAGLIYTPTADYHGADTLTIATSDLGNTGAGGALEDTDTVAITVTAVNDAPVGAVTVSGTPTQGQTLTASDSVTDVDGLGTITYHWLRDGTDTGSTGATYLLGEADVGAAMSARAVYTDGDGTVESITSAPTSAIANLNDNPTGGVTISGTPEQGQTLSASHNIVDPDGLGAITYHWLRDGVDTGSTGSTYVLGEIDVGSTMSARATYTDGHGTPEAVTSPSTAAIANVNDLPTGAVTITGTPEQGQTLTADNNLADDDGLGVITYHWLRDGVDTGITGTSYLLGESDVDAAMTARASYTDAHGTAETVDSAPTAIVANLNDSPTGGVTITGAATQGQTLVATNTIADPDGVGIVTYHWVRDGVDTGATGSSYLLGEADVGASMVVHATYTDGHGTAESLDSAAVGPVANVNDAPIGAVTVTGTPTQGQTLVAGNTLADADGLGTITYHWLRDGVDTASTGNTYVLTEADVGATISAKATYTDGHGTAEAVDSAPTAAVANVNDSVTGSVSISGTPTQGQTLVAGNTLADPDGLGTITYHWLRDGIDTGAQGVSYLLTQADVGGVISVRAAYVDGHGTAESVLSGTVGPVANVNDAPTMGNSPLQVTANPGVTIQPSFLLSDAHDADGDPLTVRIIGTVSHGQLTLAPDGSLVYVASSGFSGTDQFTYVASDGQADSTVRVVNIVVPGSIAVGPGASNPVVDTPKPPAASTGTDSGTSNHSSDPSPPTKPVVTSPPTGTKTGDDSVGSGGGLAGQDVSANGDGKGGTGQPGGQVFGSYGSASTAGFATNQAGGFVFRLEAGGFNLGVMAGNALFKVDGLNAAKPAADLGLNLSFSTVQVHGNEHTTSGLLFAENTEDRHVKVEKMVVQTSGAALSIGAVWWAARMSGLLASLMISTPAWRSIDPLPVMGLGGEDGEDGDEEGEDPSGMDARADRLFGGHQAPNRELEGIG